MFRKAVTGLCRNRRGLFFVAGAIGVLTGIEHLLSTRTAKLVQPLPVPVVASRSKPKLKITQTRSELGYVYWVLREFGEHPTYALFDTWDEAMAEATRRMNSEPATAPEPAVSCTLVPA